MTPCTLSIVRSCCDGAYPVSDCSGCLQFFGSLAVVGIWINGRASTWTSRGREGWAASLKPPVYQGGGTGLSWMVSYKNTKQLVEGYMA